MLHIQIYRQTNFCYLIFTLSTENVSLCSAVVFTSAQDYYTELVSSMLHIFSGFVFIHCVFILCTLNLSLTSAMHISMLPRLSITNSYT